MLNALPNAVSHDAPRRRALPALLAAGLLLAAGAALPARAEVAPASPNHVPGPVSPSSGKAIATPATTPIPGASTTGNATGPAGTGAPAGGKLMLRQGQRNHPLNNPPH